MKHSSFDATISALDAETSAIARSYRRYRRGVPGDIGDCGVGITAQMCNRVTNHGDMSTFSKPEPCSEVRPFLGLSKFWGTLSYFPLFNVLELVQLSISHMPVNIQLTKFV